MIVKVQKPELTELVYKIVKGSELPITTPTILAQYNEEYPYSRLSHPTLLKHLNILVEDGKVQKYKIGRGYGYYVRD
jgi:Fe2+ or Zn2+ uptake regulation protein